MASFDDDLGKVQLGETLKIVATITDADGAAANPSTSTKITIKSPDRTTAVDEQAMTVGATGTYTYYYTVPATTGQEGVYSAKVVAVGTYTSIRTFQFEVLRSV